MTPKKALAAYCLTVCVFLVGLFTLYNNFRQQLEVADQSIERGEALVLEKDLNQEKLSDLLYDCAYVADRKDADLISKCIKEKLDKDGAFPNLGALMQPSMKVSADSAYIMGGEGFKARVADDLYKLGVNEKSKCASSSNLKTGKGDVSITVKINNAKNCSKSIAGIPVRIVSYSLINEANGETEVVADTLGYALTDNKGIAKFEVEKGGHYSVLPVNRGTQFGREKGTTQCALSENVEFLFSQRPHVLTLLSPQTFSSIKQDRTILVRTPEEFKDELIRMAVIFILGWGVFLFFTFQIDRKLNTRTDYLLIITLMILTGLGQLSIFGMWNPLTDTLYGSIMSLGLLFGLILTAAIMLVNYAKLDARLTSSHYWVFRNYGWVVLVGAIALLGMMFLFGSGPDGSDAKVNLFGIQPSEIARVLIIIFIAWFFARKGTLLQDFSQRLTKRTFQRQVTIMSAIIAGMLILMGIYMILSDMGPALVVLISFILIYSIARRDFAQLLLGLLSFIALMLGARWLNNSLTMLFIAAGIWFIGWIVYWYVTKHQIYESAIFLNLVIVVFALAGRCFEFIGKHGLATRLTNRTDMAWEGVWSNEVSGGDQVVQGLWSLATGGFSGMGFGNGSPALVPAAHTDMIFTTIGEMLGFVGLVLVVLCFFILIYRTILVGCRAGYTFPFYLAIGIGIVTGVQFLVIVAGSIGLLPLTGVTLPFLSYGRVSLIISMMCFGLVLSISRLRANEIQREYINSFNGSMAACIGLFMLAGIILLVTAFRYQVLSREETLIRPAYVTNMEGARIIEYNPRIRLILRKLKAGNIYDRNGLLLATSNRQILTDAKESLTAAGITNEMFSEEVSKSKSRYYPFGAHTLFMLGDYNTMKVYNYYDNNPVGYLAEARHHDNLRGIDIPSKEKSLTAHKYKINRFLDSREQEFTAKEYDYRDLLKSGFLNYGIDRNPVIDEHNANRSNRDLKLTVDASLQLQMQNAMANAIETDPVLKNKKRLRASVVVLDAYKGDLLCSANYPLPSQDSIYMLNDKKIYGAVPFEKLPNHTPLTERDLGLTFQSQPGSTAKVMSSIAGFMKLGDEAASVTYNIRPEETIEPSTIEPWGSAVSMETSIVKSSNCYFINLVHDKDLYVELDSLYSAVGIRVNPDIIYAKGNIVPYFFELEEFNKSGEFHELMKRLGNKAVNKYDSYL
ncbi:MAG: FtsW/RodA/SpoVE family cell cycle protein, partial [Muribaculaceae bacterium]|nr:FtsW/RodA/SpoVE family cell cycle protein [Muribaculaceae bacterium]